LPVGAVLQASMASANAGIWQLRLHNDTSVAWHLQLARVVEIDSSNGSAQTARVLQSVWRQSAYPIPEGGEDVLRVSLPGEFELAPLKLQADGALSVLPPEHHAAPLGRTFVHSEASLQLEAVVPLTTPDRVTLDCSPDAASSSACTGLLQDGALVGGVLVEPAPNAAAASVAVPLSVQLRLSSQYFFRLTAARGRLEKPLSVSSPQQWAANDWRPCPSPLRAGQELRVRVLLTADGELEYQETEGAIAADTAAAAEEGGAVSSSSSTVYPLILTGDVTQASTQFVLLVLLEKELAVRLKHVPTAQLPVGHPLRAPTALPFLNVRSTASCCDGSERRDAVSIARFLDDRFRTGARLTPPIKCDAAAVRARLERIQHELLPLIDALLQQLLFGLAQGHKPKQCVVSDAQAKLAPLLDEFQASLPEAAVNATAHSVAMDDLLMVPALTLMQRTAAASMINERLRMARWLAHLQRRRSWQLLDAWLAKHLGTPKLNDFQQGDAGASFLP